MAPYLFLGLKVAPPFCPREQLLPLFTRGGDYLSFVSYNGEKYLGKEITSYSSLEEIEALKENVASLLARLSPESTFSKEALVLLPILP